MIDDNVQYKSQKLILTHTHIHPTKLESEILIIISCILYCVIIIMQHLLPRSNNKKVEHQMHRG